MADVKVQTGASFVDQVPPSVVALEYRQCNLMQRAPLLDKTTGQYVGVPIFGKDPTPRKFVECNLINVLVPVGSVVEKCNTALIRYDLDAGKEVFETGQGTVEVSLKAMEVLGRYTTAATLSRLATPQRIVDTAEAGGAKALVQEREALVKRIAQIDAELKALVELSAVRG